MVVPAGNMVNMAITVHAVGAVTALATVTDHTVVAVRMVVADMDLADNGPYYN
jgi:hypothetical protein